MKLLDVWIRKKAWNIQQLRLSMIRLWKLMVYGNGLKKQRTVCFVKWDLRKRFLISKLLLSTLLIIIPFQLVKKSSSWCGSFVWWRLHCEPKDMCLQRNFEFWRDCSLPRWIVSGKNPVLLFSILTEIYF
jgi:hypothetical protein